MKLPSLTKTIRNTKRLGEIIKVLSKFGFHQLIVDTGLHRLLSQNKDTPAEEARQDSLSLPKAVRARMVLEELGPTFIKLGQLLATRPDLIPEEWANEFKQLQDNCSQVPFSEILEVLREEFPGGLDSLFQGIDQNALAAASIAQVHRARLKDGKQVVLKVLRPGNRQLVEEDIALLETIAQLVEQYFHDLGYSPTAVAKEFAREMLKEINFINEAQATERLQRYFEDDPNISFPKVFWQATTRNVLALEEIDGRLLSTIDPDGLSAADRRAIVANGADGVFKQCLQFGFFHADPHPGNIFLLTGNRLCFIDCGTTGQLDKKTMDDLVNLVAGVAKGDLDRLCRVIISLTNVDPMVVESREFRIELQYLISHFRKTGLEHIDITGLLADFFSLLRRFRIQCPSDLILLTKALTTIEGIAERFDPEFDVLSHVEPQIQQLVLNRYSFAALRERTLKILTNSFELLEDLPADLQRFLDHARHSRFTLNLELKRIEHLSERIDTSSRIMGIAMIIAALIVGSSILILADKISREPGLIGTIGIIGLILAGVNTAGFVISYLLPRKQK